MYSLNIATIAKQIQELIKGHSQNKADIVALQTFSTTETNTGKKWTDGSPIYSIVLETKTPTVATDGTYTSKSIEFPDLPILFSGVAYSSTQRIPIPYKNNGENGIKISWSSTGGITLYSKATSYNNFDCSIYIEYIKAPAGLLSPAPDDERSIEPDEKLNIEETPEEEPQEVKKTTRKKS